jgi:hypothetical protein
VPVFFLDFRRVADAGGGLRLRLDFPGDKIGNGLREQFRAKLLDFCKKWCIFSTWAAKE